MSSNQIMFPASVVGSLPRPKFIRDYIMNNGDPFGELVNKSVLFATALQEQAGLDVITDGEWRRKSYLGVIAEAVSGIKYDKNREEGRNWTVVEKIKHTNPGFFAKEAALLKKNTNKMIKVCLPSPYLLGTRLWERKESLSAYPTKEHLITDLIPVLKKEIDLVVEAGADIVQIDDPSICLFVDKVLRAKYLDPENELKYACNSVNEVVKDVTDIETALHLCRRNKGRKGWIGEGGYDPIIPYIKDIQIDQFVLEYSIPVSGDFSALEKLPEKFKVGIGCVDCRFEHIDTPEEIVARIEKALPFISPERIVLNPDCGFAPRLSAYIPLDETYQKLRNEVKAAKILRKKYQK